MRCGRVMSLRLVVALHWHRPPVAPTPGTDSVGEGGVEGGGGHRVSDDDDE